MTPRQRLIEYCKDNGIGCEIRGRFPDLDIELCTPKGFVFGFGSHYSVTADGEWAPSGKAMYEAAYEDAVSMVPCDDSGCEYCRA